MNTKVFMLLVFFSLFAAACKEKNKGASTEIDSANQQSSELVEFTHSDFQAIFKKLALEMQLDITPGQIDHMFANFYTTLDEDDVLWETTQLEDVADIRRCTERNSQGGSVVSYFYTNDIPSRFVNLHHIPHTVHIMVKSRVAGNNKKTIEFFDYNKSDEKLTKIPNEQLIQTLDYRDFVQEDDYEAYIDSVYVEYDVYYSLYLQAKLNLSKLKPHESYIVSYSLNYPSRNLTWDGNKFALLDVKIDTPAKSSFATYCKNILEMSEKDIIDFYNGKITFLGEKFHKPYIINILDDRMIGFKEYIMDDDYDEGGNKWVLLKTNEGNYMCVFIYWRESHMIDHTRWVCSIEMFDYDAETQNIRKLESISQYLPSVSIDDFFYVEQLDAETKAFLETYWKPSYRDILYSDKFCIQLTGDYPYELANENIEKNLGKARKLFELGCCWDGEKFVLTDDY